MSGKEWIELINENMEEIREACAEAYKEACYLDDDLQLSVELYDDGEVSVGTQTYNGNDMNRDIFDGNAIHLMTFSANGLEPEILDDLDGYFKNCSGEIMSDIESYIDDVIKRLK